MGGHGDDTTDGDDRPGDARASGADAASDGVVDQIPPAKELSEGLFDESMGPGSALAHLYRGEIHRMKLWRERLDRTSNWSVIVLAAILTWAFSSSSNPHYVLLFGGVMVGTFMVIEAWRFRGYDVWRSRVRLLQRNVFAPALDPTEGIEDREWRRKLGGDYRDPAVKVPFEEAIAHRLGRVYLPLFTVVLVAWLVRVTVVPTTPWPASAAVGRVPGTAVTALVVACFLALAVIALRPRTWQSRGELREQDVDAWE